MKEERLFKIMKNVDDDLICEMIDYPPRKRETEDWQKPIYSACKNEGRKAAWRYSVTAAALLLVMGAAVFIVNIGGRIPTDTVRNTGGEAIVGTIGEISDTDRGEEQCERSVTACYPQKGNKSQLCKRYCVYGFIPRNSTGGF